MMGNAWEPSDHGNILIMERFPPLTSGAAIDDNDTELRAMENGCQAGAGRAVVPCERCPWTEFWLFSGGGTDTLCAFGVQECCKIDGGTQANGSLYRAAAFCCRCSTASRAERTASRRCASAAGCSTGSHRGSIEDTMSGIGGLTGSRLLKGSPSVGKGRALCTHDGALAGS
jgi:hypothetical protein